MQVSQRAWASVENQQRGVHHLTLPGRGQGGAEWQACLCTRSQAASDTVQCAMDQMKQSSCFHLRAFPKPNKAQTLWRPCVQSAPQGAQKTDQKGKVLHTWVVTPKALSP